MSKATSVCFNCGTRLVPSDYDCPECGSRSKNVVYEDNAETCEWCGTYKAKDVPCSVCKKRNDAFRAAAIAEKEAAKHSPAVPLVSSGWAGLVAEDAARENPPACPLCGKPLQPADKFCAECGTARPAATPSPPPAPGERTTTILKPALDPVHHNYEPLPVPVKKSGKSGFKAAFSLLGLVFIGFIIWANTNDKHDIRGNLFLPADGVVSSGDLCIGEGGFDDIGPGTQVRIKNQDGKIIATTELEFGSDTGAGCVFPFVARGVPESRYYTIEASHRGGLTFSKDEMKAANWEVALSLG